MKPPHLGQMEGTVRVFLTETHPGVPSHTWVRGCGFFRGPRTRGGLRVHTTRAFETVSGPLILGDGDFHHRPRTHLGGVERERFCSSSTLGAPTAGRYRSYIFPFPLRSLLPRHYIFAEGHHCIRRLHCRPFHSVRSSPISNMRARRDSCQATHCVRILHAVSSSMDAVMAPSVWLPAYAIQELPETPMPREYLRHLERQVAVLSPEPVVDYWPNRHDGVEPSSRALKPLRPFRL